MPRELILLRHGQAQDTAARDSERSLTAKGRQQSQDVGRRLAREGLRPDLVIASPAARARETAVLVCAELGIAAAAIAAEPAVYGGEADHLLAVLARHGGQAQRILLVGHNPGVSQLAQQLAPEAGVHLGTANAVRIVFDEEWTGLGKIRVARADVFEP